MDMQSVPGWLAIPVAVYTAYLTRKQTQMMSTQHLPRAARRRGDLPAIVWWKTPGILALGILVILAWIPWVVSQIGDRPLANVGWGQYQAIIDPATKKYTSITLFVTFDGKSLARYNESYRVFGVALHSFGIQDIEDVGDLQKSTAYYIKPVQLNILIPVNQQFIDEVNKGAVGTTYFLIVAPESMPLSGFSTLHQARNAGAKIMPVGLGAP